MTDAAVVKGAGTRCLDGAVSVQGRNEQQSVRRLVRGLLRLTAAPPAFPMDALMAPSPPPQPRGDLYYLKRERWRRLLEEIAEQRIDWPE